MLRLFAVQDRRPNPLDLAYSLAIPNGRTTLAQMAWITSLLTFKFEACRLGMSKALLLASVLIIELAASAYGARTKISYVTPYYRICHLLIVVVEWNGTA